MQDAPSEDDIYIQIFIWSEANRVSRSMAIKAIYALWAWSKILILLDNKRLKPFIIYANFYGIRDTRSLDTK